MLFIFMFRPSNTGNCCFERGKSKDNFSSVQISLPVPFPHSIAARNGKLSPPDGTGTTDPAYRSSGTYRGQRKIVKNMTGMEKQILKLLNENEKRQKSGKCNENGSDQSRNLHEIYYDCFSSKYNFPSLCGGVYPDGFRRPSDQRLMES